MDRYKRMKIHRGQPGPAYQEPLRPRKIRSTAPYLFVDGQSSPHPTSPDLLSPPSHEKRIGPITMSILIFIYIH
jgi:hypothetical protein